MWILVCSRTIDQGNEVYGFQYRFGQSIIGSINHLQQLGLIGSYRNNHSPANGKLLHQCSRYLGRCGGNQYAIEWSIFRPSGVAIPIAHPDIAQLHRCKTLLSPGYKGFDALDAEQALTQAG